MTATNAEFDRLIGMAFQTRSLDLSAVPLVLRTERFDIVAKASHRPIGDEYWDMLRVLIEQRFRLKYHTVNKTVHLYALIQAKPNVLGRKINRSADPDCPQNPTRSNFCGVSTQPGKMIGQRVTMLRLARELSAFTDRPVQDQTGLSGSFYFQMTWTPDENLPTDGQAKLLNGYPLDATEPSFYDAIRGQLGFRLEPKTGQIQVLVIDHAEQPEPY